MSPMPQTLLNQKQHPRAMMNPLESRFQNLVRTRQRACGIEKVPLLGDESYETFSLSERAVGGQSVQGQETSSKQATKNNKIGLGSWLRFEVLRVQLGASERLFLLHGTLKDNAANSDQSVERLGLLEEDQVAEWFTLPSHPAYSAKLPTKRKQRRSSVNTLKESDKETDIFTFEASCFGDPFENDGARPAIHQYFTQEDSSEEEQEDKTTQPISSSPMESLSLKRRHKKKHSKKKKKKHDKKRKKEKRKREESSSEKKKRHKKKRKVSS
jgi:hypothetical protein